MWDMRYESHRYMLDVLLLLLWVWESESTPVRCAVKVEEVVKIGSLAPVQPETVRQYCNILSVSPSQSPLTPEPLSSTVISLCLDLWTSYITPPALVRTELGHSFNIVSSFLSLCPSSVIWARRGISMKYIQIRFTEIIFVKSTTLQNYPLILYKL